VGPLEAVFEPLLLQDQQRLAEREEERDRGRPGRIVLLDRFEVSGEVEVERPRVQRGDRPVGEVDEREPGGSREALLAAGDDRVDAPRLDREREPGDRADPVDEEERSGRADRGSEGLEVVREPDAGLVVDQADRFDVALRELGVDRIDRYGLAQGAESVVTLFEYRCASVFVRSPKFPFVRTSVRPSLGTRQE